MSAPPWANRFRGIRRLEVLRTEQLTPGMRRITLGGEEIADLPEGPNVKLLLPPRADAPLILPLADAAGRAIWAEGANRPVVRTYTARRHDRAAGELDIDFVLHGDAGPASAWAARARPGDVVGIGGPGGREIRPADWYLLAADQTGLPAVARMLERMPADARGYALIEIPGPEERQALRHPSGVTVQWLWQRGIEPGSTTRLAEALRARPWPSSGDPFVWVGAESANARAIRAHVREERGLERHRFLIIGYWKRGLSETEYAARDDHDRGPDYHQVAQAERERSS